MIMYKTGNNSHFDVIRGDEIPNYGNRILQIDTEKEYENGGYGVYVCEVDDSPEVTNTSKKEEQDACTD